MHIQRPFIGLESFRMSDKVHNSLRQYNTVVLLGEQRDRTCSCYFFSSIVARRESTSTPTRRENRCLIRTSPAQPCSSSMPSPNDPVICDSSSWIYPRAVVHCGPLLLTQALPALCIASARGDVEAAGLRGKNKIHTLYIDASAPSQDYRNRHCQV